MTGPNTVRALPLSHVPLPFLDRPTQLLKEAPTSRWSYTSTFDSTTLFEWTTLTGAVLPSHAEPPLITNHDSEAVPDQSERSGSFGLASHQCSQWGQRERLRVDPSKSSRANLRTFSSSFPSNHFPGSGSSYITMTLFPLSVLPTSMPRRNAHTRPLCLWGPRNVSGRGKMSVSTKMSCMQTRTGMEMRRRPRGGQ